VASEHRIVARADWIIDMGPEGGNKGGRVMFEGTPQQLLEARSGAPWDRSVSFMLC